MHEPRDRTSEAMNEESEPPGDTVSDSSPSDPYADLENVFDEPIVIDDADFPPQGSMDELGPAEDVPSERPEAVPPSSDEPVDRLWARLDAMEAELRRGSERTLEALRRLGERMGAELGMLDKRSINLELTVARLRAITEAVESATRRGPEPQAAPATTATPPAEPPPSRESAFTLEEAPAAPDPDPEWEPSSTDLEDREPPQATLPGTRPAPSDWRHPSFGPPAEDEPPDDLG